MHILENSTNSFWQFHIERIKHNHGHIYVLFYRSHSINFWIIHDISWRRYIESKMKYPPS
jgi:hypothetical protein